MEITIFYSWQADLPNNTNRGLIHHSLEKAAKEIRNDGGIYIEPRVDRDTSGVAGSPNIPETILGKIDSCTIFVADISIINAGSKFRPTPNPNVLLELGYALKTLGGWARIIMVCNEEFGKIRKLPFDIPERRVIPYRLSEETVEKALVRSELSSKLKNQIKLIAEGLEVRPVVSESTESPKTDDILIEARRIAFEQDFVAKRKRWMISHESGNDIRDSVDGIFGLIDERLTSADNDFSALGISLLTDKSLRVLSTPLYGCQLAIVGPHNINLNGPTVHEISLHQVLFTKILRSNTTEAIKESYLLPDLGKDGSVIWLERGGKQLSPQEIADRMFTWLLKQIEDPQMSSAKQANILGTSLGVGVRRRR